MQGLSTVSGLGKCFYWVLSNFLQAGDCVIAPLCVEGTFYFLQASFKQGIICVLVDFVFLHLCGYYLFDMTTAWLIWKVFRYSVKISTYMCFPLINWATLSLPSDCAVLWTKQVLWYPWIWPVKITEYWEKRN